MYKHGKLGRNNPSWEEFRVSPLSVSLVWSACYLYGFVFWSYLLCAHKGKLGRFGFVSCRCDSSWGMRAGFSHGWHIILRPDSDCSILLGARGKTAELRSKGWTIYRADRLKKTFLPRDEEWMSLRLNKLASRYDCFSWKVPFQTWNAKFNVSRLGCTHMEGKCPVSCKIHWCWQQFLAGGTTGACQTVNRTLLLAFVCPQASVPKVQDAPVQETTVLQKSS